MFKSMSDENKHDGTSNVDVKIPSPSRIPVTPQSQHSRRPKKPTSPSKNKAKNVNLHGSIGQRIDLKTGKEIISMAPKQRQSKPSEAEHDGDDARPADDAVSTTATATTTTAERPVSDSSEVKSSDAVHGEAGQALNENVEDIKQEYEVKIKRLTDDHNDEKESWYEDIRKNQDHATKFEEESKSKDLQIAKLRSRLAEAENSIHHPETGLNHQLEELKQAVDKLTEDVEREKGRAGVAVSQSEQLQKRFNSLISDCEDKDTQIIRLMNEKAELEALNDEMHTDLDSMDKIQAESDEDRALRQQAEQKLTDINVQLEEIFHDLGSGLSSEDYLKHAREQHFGRQRRDESRSSIDVIRLRKRDKPRDFSNASLHDELEGFGDSFTEDESEDEVDGDELGTETGDDNTLNANAFDESKDEPTLSEKPKLELSEIMTTSISPKAPVQQLSFGGITSVSLEPLSAEAQRPRKPSPTDTAPPSTSPKPPTVDETDPVGERERAPDKLALSPTVSIAAAPINLQPAQTTRSSKHQREKSPAPITSALMISPLRHTVPPDSKDIHKSTFDCLAALHWLTKLHLLGLLIAMITFALSIQKERHIWLEPNGLTQQRMDEYDAARHVQRFAHHGIENWLGVDLRLLG